MAGLWITLSTTWSFSSVQAALNVVIAVLGVVGIWAFSRFWWQRGRRHLLREEGNVPLHKLLTFTGPGEGWDLMTLLKKELFTKHNWHLVLQLVVVLFVTAASILAGPISQAAIRSGETIRQRPLQVMQTTKGAGAGLNLLNANVLWNNTVKSLDSAGFPLDQMMDFVPPWDEPWVYRESEWDPTWTTVCNKTDPEVIQDMYGDVNYTFTDPINAFPKFRDTFDAKWLNNSAYRTSADYCGWVRWDEDPTLKHELFYVLVQSDPMVDDQMHLNQAPLTLSLSTLHVQNGNISTDTRTVAGRTTYRPDGLFKQAWYSRVECVISRRAGVNDEEHVPWLWTNDTTSIVRAFADYNRYPLEVAAGRNATVFTPTADRLFRFYQAYMASITTNAAIPFAKEYSIRLRTVDLSAIFLALILLLFVLTIWGVTRYLVFWARHKETLDKLGVPDGKMEWMVYAVKSAPDMTGPGRSRKDREHFQSGVFARESTPDCPEQKVQEPQIARVWSSRDSLSRVSSSGQITIHSSPPTIQLASVSEMLQQPLNLTSAALSTTSASSLSVPSLQRPPLSPSFSTQVFTDGDSLSRLGSSGQQSSLSPTAKERPAASLASTKAESMNEKEA